jgi:hypothetical protein
VAGYFSELISSLTSRHLEFNTTQESFTKTSILSSIIMASFNRSTTGKEVVETFADKVQGKTGKETYSQP